MELGLLDGFVRAFSPLNLWYCFLGSMLGTLVGVLPAVGPAATIAILLPLTAYLDATQSIIMLAGIFYGAMYGGSTTSILMNIPGEAASVPTCIDGYQMTKQGRAGEALAIAAIGSFIAGTVGVLFLSFAAPLARRIRSGLRFSRVFRPDVLQPHRPLLLLRQRPPARRVCRVWRGSSWPRSASTR